MPPTIDHPKTALAATLRPVLVHDYLLVMRGAERTFARIADIWPRAPVSTLLYDHSIFGERLAGHPILPEADLLDETWHARRHDLRPGITGPWQIYGRSDIPFQDMVRFDYQYVAGWSLARDLEILLATVPAVLSGRGAY